jgi:hypothetical protein
MEHGIIGRMKRIACTAFRDDVVGAVYDVKPRAAVLVVVAREVKDAGAPTSSETLKSSASW